MHHPRPQRGSLDRAGQQHAAIAHRVSVPERPLGHVGDPFDVAMRVHRPDGSGHQTVVVEDAQVAKLGIGGVVVGIEAEVPVGAEPAPIDVIERLARPQLDHGCILCG